MFATADARELAGVESALGSLPGGEESALGWFVPALGGLLDCPVAMVFSLAGREADAPVERVETAGCPASELQRVLGDVASRNPGGWGRWGCWDPSRLEPWQRDAPIALPELLERTGRRELPPVLRALYPRLGAKWLDQLRVILCDGPDVLAWVGGFREAPFTEREKEILRALRAPLRRRLALERDLGRGRLAAEALDAALDALGAPAFIVSGSGGVEHANAAGRLLLGREPATRRTLAAVAAGATPPGLDVARLGDGGARPRRLAVFRSAPRADASARARAAARRWRLTPRQAEVLALVAEGKHNRGIAASLGCSERTVETHVGALLLRMECGCRAELVARLWRPT